MLNQPFFTPFYSGVCLHMIFEGREIIPRDVNVSYFFRISYFFGACAHSPFLYLKCDLNFFCPPPPKSSHRFINYFKL